MLVLSRKVGQTIQIGDQVRVTVTQIKGRTIRIGIEAPAEIPIRRGELEIHQPLGQTFPAGDGLDVNLSTCGA